MSKEQIKKDFEELYFGKDQNRLISKYYRQKKREMLLLTVTGLLLVVLTIFSEYKKNYFDQENFLEREENPGEVTLQVKGESGNWQDISFYMEEKEYREDELELLYDSAVEKLPGIIINKNKSLEEVKSDLNFVSEIEDHPFLLSWSAGTEEYIDNTGKLVITEREEDRIVQISVIFSYGEWEREHIFFIKLLKSDPLSWKERLQSMLREKEEETREESRFLLPQTMDGETLIWRRQGKNGGYLLLGILPLTLFVYWKQKDYAVRREVIKRREELKREYSNFVTRLVLYLQAGISTRECLWQMAKEYKQQQGGERQKNYLYEEITYLCIQMKNGMPEKSISVYSCSVFYWMASSTTTVPPSFAVKESMIWALPNMETTTLSTVTMTSFSGKPHIH